MVILCERPPPAFILQYMEPTVACILVADASNNNMHLRILVHMHVILRWYSWQALAITLCGGVKKCCSESKYTSFINIGNQRRLRRYHHQIMWHYYIPTFENGCHLTRIFFPGELSESSYLCMIICHDNSTPVLPNLKTTAIIICN